jgi:sugar phosphate permease
VRSRASAWCRNAFEIPGGVLGALVVGLLGDHVSGPVGSIGDAVSLVIVAMLPPAMVIAWLFVPETNAEDMVAMDEAVLA